MRSTITMRAADRDESIPHLERSQHALVSDSLSKRCTVARLDLVLDRGTATGGDNAKPTDLSTHAGMTATEARKSRPCACPPTRDFRS
jgi:hypothetical protein